MRVEDWRTVGHVPGGKKHLIVRIQRRRSDISLTMVRARTDCGRLTWVTLVPWTDGWYSEPDACRACAPHVADRVAAEPPPVADPPERAPLTEIERAERLDRLRDMRLMETLHFISVAAQGQAARPKPLVPREALEAEIKELRRDLDRARKAIRTYGETIDSQTGEMRALRAQNDRLVATNRVLARDVAKAEVLREFVATLYR